MGIAFWAASGLVSPLQQMLGWFLPATPQRVRPQQRKTPRSTKSPRTLPIARPAAAVQARPARPLRVVRLVEEGRPPAGAGRMAISGRMADVCAELDRLAASEAARH